MKKYSKWILKNILVPIILPVIIIVAWQMCANMEIINTRLFPAPSDVVKTFSKLSDSGVLKESVLVSGKRVFIGFMVGGISGLVVGIIAGLSSVFNQGISFIVGALRPIPMVAWIPLFILWFGIDEMPKIAVITVGSFWPVLVNTSQGIMNVDRKYLEVGKILEKNEMEILLKIIWPASLPTIFTGVRLGISSAWNCVVTAEMIAASAGVGHMIMQGRQYGSVPQILVGVALIGVIGLVLDAILLGVEACFLKWNAQEQ